MRRGLFSLLLIVASSSLLACMPIDFSEEEGETPPPISVDSPYPGFEQVVHQTFGERDWRFAPEGPTDPCLCDGYDCLQDWTETHYGCDICVTLLCDGSASHVCNACP